MLSPWKVPGEAAEGVVAAAGAEPEADGHEQAAHGGERPPAEAGLAARLRERLLPPADAERTRTLCPLSVISRLHSSHCEVRTQTNKPSVGVAGGLGHDGHELRVRRHQRRPAAERRGGGGATATAGSAARREPCRVCLRFFLWLN